MFSWIIKVDFLGIFQIEIVREIHLFNFSSL
jgi:hypothetical protein